MEHSLLLFVFLLFGVASGSEWPFIIKDGCPEKNPDYDETDPNRKTCGVYLCCDYEDCSSGKTPSVSPSNGLGCIGGDCDTKEPTSYPSESPTFITTVVGTIINRLTNAPTPLPSTAPSLRPSQNPSDAPSDSPSESPSSTPSDSPSDSPSQYPTWISTSKEKCPLNTNED